MVWAYLVCGSDPLNPYALTLCLVTCIEISIVILCHTSAHHSLQHSPLHTDHTQVPALASTYTSHEETSRGLSRARTRELALIKVLHR